MKVFKYVTGIVFAILLVIGLVTNAEATEYLGDFCWSTIDGGGNTIITKLGAFHMGAGHYQLLGTAEHSTDGTFVVRGNAEIIGDEIHVSAITVDGSDNAMTSMQLHAVLDPSTFNGTYNQLITSAAGWTDQTEIRFQSGTMTSIPCN